MSLDLKDKKKLIGFSFAWNGLVEVVKTERNFQIHLICMFLTIIAGIYFQLIMIEWALIFLVSGLVLVTEMINSAIEQMIDYFKPEIHPAAKIIKDISAGAVLLAAMVAVVIGVFIFVPKLLFRLLLII